MKHAWFSRYTLAALAAACSLLGTEVPASAVTVGPGTVLKLSLDAPSVANLGKSIDALLLNFTYGSDASAALFSVQAFTGADTAISGAVDVSGGATAATLTLSNSISGSDWPVYVVLTGLVGTSSFDLTPPVTAGLANGTAGVFETVSDAVTFTPIPATLPLLLTGSGILYTIVRRKKKRPVFAAA